MYVTVCVCVIPVYAKLVCCFSCTASQPEAMRSKATGSIRFELSGKTMAQSSFSVTKFMMHLSCLSSTSCLT